MHGCVRFTAGCVLGLALLAFPPAGAATPFIDGAIVDIPPGSWHGRYEFPGVYCLTFPVAGEASRLVSELLNGDAVSLTRVDYGPLQMSVVSSTMRASLTDEREHLDQIARAADAAASLPDGLYSVGTEDSPMGPVVRRRLTNVASRGPRHLAPFPIDLAFHDLPPERIATVAELRLFSRWPDRYEVAARATVPEPGSPAEVEQARQLVEVFADATLRALQACTALLPPRVPTTP